MPIAVPQADLDMARRNWGWDLVLGILLIVLGTVAIGHPYLMTIAAVLVFGWLLLISGVAQCVVAFQMRAWGGFFLHLLEGILEAVVGVLLIALPGKGALIMTLLLAAYLLVGGLFRLFAAIALRFPGSGWVALGGVISAVLGVMLAAEWPSSAVWFIGMCVGIDLIFHGSAWIAFALAVRKLPTSPA